MGINILKVGALGTHKTLGLAVAKQAKFLLASTSEVYGDPLVHPQSEEYLGNVNPIGIRGVYDEAKRFAEAMTMAYHRVHGTDVRIARIFNTYGERMRQDDGRAVPNFIIQALKGRDLTVYGDGQQTRSICHYSDLIAGLYKLMLSDVTTPVNLGNPSEITMLDLAHKIIAMTGSPRVASPSAICRRTTLGCACPTLPRPVPSSTGRPAWGRTKGWAGRLHGSNENWRNNYECF